MIRIPRVLSIAGTDPTGGAGIQADLKSISANGGYGMAVVTALVAQNTQGVRSIHLPPTSFLTEQLEAVSEDVEIDSVKIGMLANVEIIATVSKWLDQTKPPLVVLDPVMVATSGDKLLDDAAIDAIKNLISYADLITPNVPELAVLADQEVARNWEEVLSQARQVSSDYRVTVLAKGGHLSGDTVNDALVDTAGNLPGGRQLIEFAAPRVETKNTHGTGCSLSSALATLLPRTPDWEVGTRLAKEWLTQSIAQSDELGVGQGHGPINHFAGLWERSEILAPLVTGEIAGSSAGNSAGEFTGKLTAEVAGEITGEWWEQTREIRRQIDELAFIKDLADGTLDANAFVWYLAQDALYLRDYARVLAQASVLSPTPEEQEFWAFNAYESIATEMILHRDWLPTNETYSAPASPTTVAYVDHLLASASRGYEVLVAALLPCFWLYQVIGETLSASASPDHPYNSWLSTYSDPSFAEYTKKAIKIVDQISLKADPETRQRMWEAFRASSVHELAFFAVPLIETRDTLRPPY